MPALVVHGLADRMVHVSGGRATARAIPGAELLLVDGMGHDLPARPLPDVRRRDRPAPPTHGAEWASDYRDEDVATAHSDAGCQADSGRAAIARVAQSESRSPVSVSNTCTLLRVGRDVDGVALVHRVAADETRTITLPGVPSTSLVP